MTAVSAVSLQAVVPFLAKIIKNQVISIRDTKEKRDTWDKRTYHEHDVFEVKSTLMSVDNDGENDSTAVNLTFFMNGIDLGPINITNDDIDGDLPFNFMDNVTEMAEESINTFMRWIARQHISKFKYRETFKQFVLEHDYQGFGAMYIPNTTWSFSDQGYGILITNDFGEVIYQHVKIDKLCATASSKRRHVEYIVTHLINVLCQQYSAGNWKRDEMIEI